MAEKKMIVLFINPFVFDHKLGGMDSLLLDILRNMDTQRFKRIVVLPRPGGTATLYEEVADDIVYLDTAPITKAKSLFSLILTIVRIPLSAFRLWKIIRRTGARLVHVQTELVFSGGLAAAWAGIPSIYMVQSSPYRPQDRWAWDIVIRVLDKLAQGIIVVSKDVMNEFLERGVKSEKLHLIYNGIDTSHFHPMDEDNRNRIRLEFLTGDQRHIVGIMGRLHVSKGVETFLRAAAIVNQQRKDVRFLIVGAAGHPKPVPYESQLKDLATQLGLDDCITFTGFRDDVPQVLNAMDVFQFPSLREPFGLALAEAMAMERAVVASNSGGVPEFVISGVNGYLVPPNDPVGFARITLDLLNDPKRRKELGHAARKYIETHLSVEKQARAVEAVYEASIKLK